MESRNDNSKLAHKLKSYNVPVDQSIARSRKPRTIKGNFGFRCLMLNCEAYGEMENLKP